jgi:hypothetical protein
MYYFLVSWGTMRLGTSATICPIVPPRKIVSVVQSVECGAGETEVLGENLPQCHFVHYKSHMI